MSLSAKTILMAIAIFSGTIAQATEISYDDLRNLFRNGTKPDNISLMNAFYPGRCFRSGNPDSPIGSALLMRQLSGESLASFEALIGFNENRTDIFDNMNYNAGHRALFYTRPAFVPNRINLASSTELEIEAYDLGTVKVRETATHLVTRVKISIISTLMCYYSKNIPASNRKQ